MTMRIITALLMVAGLVSSLPASQATQPANPPVFEDLLSVRLAPPPAPIGPKIKFATNEYDFGRIQSGSVIKFAFIFTNAGDQLLEVTGVQPQCGCTTAGEWTRKVEPGQVGTIPLQYNSGHSIPMPILKTVTVTSTDRSNSPLVLRLKGVIWNPVDVQPSIAALGVMPDNSSGSTSLHIINNMDTPVSVFDPQCTPTNLTLTLQTNTPGKDYTLTASVTPPLTPTTGATQITLKTSATNMPTVTATVYLNILPVVVVSPPEIRLSQAPLDRALTASVAIQNASTNQLVLSEPSCNATNVDVQVREMQPGKLFTVLVAFPEGFESPAGQQTVVTFKSNLPKAPTIRIPVTQIGRPPLVRTVSHTSPAPVVLPKPPLPASH